MKRVLCSVFVAVLSLAPAMVSAEIEDQGQMESSQQQNDFNSRSQAISALMAKKSGGSTQAVSVDSDAAPGGASLVTGIQGLAVCLGIFFVGIYLYKRYVIKTPTVN